ncbi:MAG: hypothetical protein F6K14_24525 [Symploca sp. SIO2C1]|nr:hypothetical protein [Symploca sp. SIO2C1]
MTLRSRVGEMPDFFKKSGIWSICDRISVKRLHTFFRLPYRVSEKKRGETTQQTRRRRDAETRRMKIPPHISSP